MLPISTTAVDQALVDWVSDWKDKWGYGTLRMLCPNPPQPPSEMNVHKAIIASARGRGHS